MLIVAVAALLVVLAYVAGMSAGYKEAHDVLGFRRAHSSLYAIVFPLRCLAYYLGWFFLGDRGLY